MNTIATLLIAVTALLTQVNQPNVPLALKLQVYELAFQVETIAAQQPVETVTAQGEIGTATSTENIEPVIVATTTATTTPNELQGFECQYTNAKFTVACK